MRQVAATSEPMNPAPTTTTRGPSSSRARRSSASSTVRSTKIPSRAGVSGQRARGRAGGEQRAVERERLAAVEGQDARGGVERGRPHAEPQLDLELVVGRAAQRELLGLPLTGEQLLRQRRTVVREVRLGADEHDPAVEPVPAQRLGGPQPRQRGPHHHHGSQRVSSPRSAGPSSQPRRPRTRIDPCPGGADKGRCYGAYRVTGTGPVAGRSFWPTSHGRATLDVRTFRVSTP